MECHWERPTDVYGSAAQPHMASGCYRYRQHLEHSLREVTGLEHLVWRPNMAMLQEEGLDMSSPTPEEAPADMSGPASGTDVEESQGSVSGPDSII